MKIIVTRPSPDGETFAAQIAAIGAEPILSPVMVIRPRPAPIDLAGAGAIAFTSANGVRAFASISPERRLPVYAVGAMTASVTHEANFGNVIAAKGDVKSLAALIAQTKPSGEIVHLAGGDVAGDLVAMLAASGLRARRVVVYDAVAAEALSHNAAQALSAEAHKLAVAFFSPRSVRLFLDQVKSSSVETALAEAVALCLSKEVATAAMAARWRAVDIAPVRSADGILALIGGRLAGRKGRKDRAS